MKLAQLLKSPQALVLGCLLASATVSGCQTTIGGQTLPSATYLRDDVEYFPAGPEYKLSNTERAMEEYRAAQSGLLPEAPPPAP
jgi:hypothetical protein